MVRRFTRLAALLAVGSTVAAGCSNEQTTPVGVTTVRLAVVPGAQHGGMPFRTDMTQEVFHGPTMTHFGDPDGTGSALITVNRGQQEVCWEVSVSNISLPVTAAHIHRGIADLQGPVVVNLFPTGGSSWSGCRSAGPDLNWSVVEEIVANPAGFYANAHNAQYGPGAVRGQLAQ